MTVLLMALLHAAHAEPPAALLDAMHRALGGDAVDRAATVQMTVRSEHWDFGQARDWGDPPARIGTMVTRLTHGFDGGLYLQLDPAPVYPAEWHWSYTETYASGGCGLRRGRDEFGARPRAPVPAGRVAYRTKLAQLTSVWWLDRTVVRGDVTDWVVVDGARPTLTGTWHGAPVTLTLDPETHRPASFTVLEDNAIMGDVPYRVVFADWRAVGDGWMPGTAEHTLAGHVVQQDRLEDMAVDVPARFDVPARACRESDPAEWTLGHHRARFLTDFTFKGFLVDHDLLAHPIDWRPVAPGVFMAAGALYTSMVVDLGDRVVVAELPYSTARSESLLDRIAAELPGREVAHVVNSHLHHDHFGGLRAAVARGIPVVVAPNKVEALQTYAAAPKTLVPDAQSAAGAAPVTVPVDDAMMTIRGRDRDVEVYRIDVPHGGQMLLTWVPDTETLFVADLYSPGIPPTRGLGGAIGRLVIASAFPRSKATFTSWAADLVRVLDARGLEPERIVGGHGHYAGTLREVRTLVRWGERGRDPGSPEGALSSRAARR